MEMVELEIEIRFEFESKNKSFWKWKDGTGLAANFDKPINANFATVVNR